MVDKREYSAAYERNREPILEVLKGLEIEGDRVLEVGSGSGQHICYLAQHLEGADGRAYHWQPTEQRGHLESIEAWRVSQGVEDRVARPRAIDLLQEMWWEEAFGEEEYAMVMSINVVHIVAWEGVKRLLEGAASVLRRGGVVYLYGPYRSKDRVFEASNEAFDAWLKERYEGGGVRDLEEVEALALASGLELVEDRAMPANNRSLIFRKR